MLNTLSAGHQLYAQWKEALHRNSQGDGANQVDWWGEELAVRDAWEVLANVAGPEEVEELENRIANLEDEYSDYDEIKKNLDDATEEVESLEKEVNTLKDRIDILVENNITLEEELRTLKTGEKK